MREKAEDFKVVISLGTKDEMTKEEVEALFDKIIDPRNEIQSWSVQVEFE